MPVAAVSELVILDYLSHIFLNYHSLIRLTAFFGLLAFEIVRLFFRCFAELLSADYSFGEKNLSCKISDECMERMVGHRGLTGYQLTHQILYVAVAQQVLFSC